MCEHANIDETSNNKNKTLQNKQFNIIRKCVFQEFVTIGSSVFNNSSIDFMKLGASKSQSTIFLIKARILPNARSDHTYSKSTQIKKIN